MVRIYQTKSNGLQKGTQDRYMIHNDDLRAMASKKELKTVTWYIMMT